MTPATAPGLGRSRCAWRTEQAGAVPAPRELSPRPPALPPSPLANSSHGRSQEPVRSQAAPLAVSQPGRSSDGRRQGSPTGVAATGRRSHREGRKQLKRRNPKPSAREKLFPGPPGSGAPWSGVSDSGATQPGARSAHLSCLVWFTMDRTFSSPSIFGLPNSSSFTCWERKGKAVSPGARASALRGEKRRWARVRGGRFPLKPKAGAT